MAAFLLLVSDRQQAREVRLSASTAFLTAVSSTAAYTRRDGGLLASMGNGEGRSKGLRRFIRKLRHFILHGSSLCFCRDGASQRAIDATHSPNIAGSNILGELKEELHGQV